LATGREMSANELIKIDNIKSRIFTIRGLQVMLDSDLAELYGVSTKVFNQAVKRNADRFPERFMFTVSDDEFASLRSQFVTSNKKEGRGGRRYLPNVFTEQGVAMLSAVLKSDTAIYISIKVIDAFVEMRQFLSENLSINQRIETVERKQIEYKSESDEKFNILFKALENNQLPPTEGVFYDGQIFDAYNLAVSIIKTADKSIILIDNYVDETVLTMLSKRKDSVETIIYTANISKQLELDLKKHNAQYKPVEVRLFKKSHDRFMIIDEEHLYHIGASLKDLGKKMFAFSKISIDPRLILKNLK